ncbi:MAG: hypothetical protein AVDCRST_MAG29-266, partial [uncultured Nocardioidaceae bacterium]
RPPARPVHPPARRAAGGPRCVACGHRAPYASGGPAPRRLPPDEGPPGGHRRV